VASPENTFVDTGLTPNTQYSYAVFAHDAQHVAVGATLTVSTRAPGTDAVLKINPLHPSGDNVTIGNEVAFDATDSLPADGTTISSWSVDYGDGSVDTFTAGPFDPVDLNTSHTYTGNGDKTVTLTVTDSANNTATDTITLHVFNAPTVSLSVDTIAANGDVTFKVDASTPNGTAITSWQMDVSGDEVFFLPDPGTPAGAPDPTMVVNFAPGTYAIDFEITNNAGASVFATPVNLVVP
jgi:PKD repeat protein